MTAEDLEDEDDAVTYPSERITVWLLLAILWTMISNMFGAVTQFWAEMTSVFVGHANYKNERKRFKESVFADLKQL